MYLPEVLASSGVFRYRIVELHIKGGIFQTGAINLNSLLVEVNTLTGKGTDCKSAGTAFGGSNPPSPNEKEKTPCASFLFR